MVFFKSDATRRKGYVAYLLRLFLNMLHYMTENYLINRLIVDRVNNDLGASFTAISRKNNRIVKRARAEGEAKLRDEIEWILRFKGTRLERYLPKIYSYSLEPGDVHYEMRYYDYPNLRRIVDVEINARFFVRLRLLHLFELLEGELWIESNSSECPPDFVENEYFRKFYERRDAALAMDPYFAHFYDAPVLELNGKRLPNAAQLIEAIASDPVALASLVPPRLYISHGDLHSNNILCGIGHSTMILIDCRGRSSGGLLYFDPAYDIAKLFHDFRGMYSLIERHAFSIFHRIEAEPRIEYCLTDERMRAKFRRHYAFIRAVAHRRLTRFSNLLERADFAEAMLFLTMIPMHMRLRDEGLMCYVTGVAELNSYCSRYRPALYASVCKKLGIEGESIR